MKKPQRPRLGKSQPLERRQSFDESKYLTDEEYDRLHAHMLHLKKTDTRNAALILTAMHTGARASEILNIQAQDLIPHSTAIRIHGLKNSNTRDVPVPKWLYRLLEKLPRETDNLFNISYARLDQIWTSYRTTNKKFHSLRHTYAIRGYRHCKDIKVVQQALGHRQFNNTLIYLKYVNSDQQMRKLLVEE